MSDLELEILKRHRHTHPAPTVDVAERVVATIQSIPIQAKRRESRVMAACAALCAGTAALLLFAAVIRPSTSADESNLYDLVLDSQEVSVQSLLD